MEGERVRGSEGEESEGKVRGRGSKGERDCLLVPIGFHNFIFGFSSLLLSDFLYHGYYYFYR